MGPQPLLAVREIKDAVLDGPGGLHQVAVINDRLGMVGHGHVARERIAQARMLDVHDVGGELCAQLHFHGGVGGDRLAVPCAAVGIRDGKAHVGGIGAVDHDGICAGVVATSQVGGVLIGLGGRLIGGSLVGSCALSVVSRRSGVGRLALRVSRGRVGRFIARGVGDARVRVGALSLRLRIIGRSVGVAAGSIAGLVDGIGVCRRTVIGGTVGVCGVGHGHVGRLVGASLVTVMVGGIRASLVNSTVGGRLSLVGHTVGAIDRLLLSKLALVVEPVGLVVENLRLLSHGLVGAHELRSPRGGHPAREVLEHKHRTQEERQHLAPHGHGIATESTPPHCFSACMHLRHNVLPSRGHRPTPLPISDRVPPMMRLRLMIILFYAGKPFQSPMQF